MVETLTARLHFTNPETGEPTEPLPHQERFLASKSFILIMEGGLGPGKTSVLLRKLGLHCLRFPGLEAFLGRKEAKETKTDLVAEFLDLMGPLVAKHVTRDYEIYIHTGQDRQSRIRYGGLDISHGAKGRVRGPQYGFIAVDQAEDLVEDMFYELVARCRRTLPFDGFYRQVAMTMNVAGGWPARLVTTKEIRPGYAVSKEDIEVIHTKTSDNPYLPKDYIRFLQNLPDSIRSRLFLGDWDSVSDFVYPEIRPIDELPADMARWPVVRLMDYGYQTPFVCLFFAISPELKPILFREYYQIKKHFRVHLKAIDEMSRDLILVGNDRICRRAYQTESSGRTVVDMMREFIKESKKSGIIQRDFRFIPINDDREIGMPKTAQFLKDVLEIYTDACINTISELKLLTWDFKKMQKSKKLETLGEDHACDCIRGFVNDWPRIMGKAKHYWDTLQPARAKTRAEKFLENLREATIRRKQRTKKVLDPEFGSW